MPAFRRRTMFATPIIAIISCGGGQSRPEQPSIPGQSWTVFARDGGLCEASTIEHCPKGALCNPPPPREIDCPTGIDRTVQVVEKPDHTCAVVPPGCVELACATQVTACPAPFGAPRKLRGPAWTVARHDAHCLAVPECSTPPCDAAATPRAVECPPSLGAAPAELRVRELPSGACAVVAATCLDESCAGDKVSCPMPAGKDLPPLVWDVVRTDNACTATTTGPIAGEHVARIVCPPEQKIAPRFRIRRADLAAPCEIIVGSGAGGGVPTKCPE